MGQQYYIWENLMRLRPEFYKAFGETAIMLGISGIVSIIIGGLLGVWLYTTGKNQIFANRRVNHILGFTIDFIRAFPFVILMIVMMKPTRMIMGTTFGPVAASISLSVAAMFYFARLVEQNLAEVPKGVVEAALAMGAKPMTIIIRVLLNEARAGLVRSIAILIIATLGTSAAAGLIGGGGVGDLGIRYGHQRYMADVLWAVVALLSALVVCIQTLGNHLAARLDKR
ncbi:methionine ABC transporter ATP-binding protein [Eikenella sp. NML080894]|uniref:methionine ABC transporter permease n=1 Tax=Eikenella TaxID=538 RepID=UPI0007E196F6|nr:MULTISPECIES: methionine ABC transporter permease [Eikenella]OAM35638.1 methionine ABC transporter ATP-binding protein [Eikenella sp. NML080894]OAM45653.1 methionine ABC transporter ATP-binding protein [Eikenella sp. NML99-0057]